MVTGQDIANAATELLGVWYVWWKEGDPIPMWLDEWGNTAPPRSHMDEVGVMCSDLVNWARMECGLPPVGGCPAYYDWLLSNGAGAFDASTPGVAGAICVNPGPWRGDTVLAQGHISIYTDEHTLIQATDGQGSWAGVHQGEQDHDAGWANYWLYGLMPDVNYEGVEAQPEMSVTPQEVPSVATEYTVNWFGIGADGVVRLGGERVDWTGGWIGQTKDGLLVRVK
jgi:hypothetical protein